jgi:ABC-2 type transport system ATP-binding protein
VFLDEPTSGLDPVGRILVRDIIREERAQGATVFLNSHLLSEVEVTCDRVVFIKQGTVVKAVAMSELEQGTVPVEIRSGPLPTDRAALLNGLNRFGRDARVDGDRLYVTIDDQQRLPDLARWIIGQGVDVYALTPQHVSLESLFLQVVGMDGGL